MTSTDQHPKRLRVFNGFLAVQAVALLIVSLWFRLDSLGKVPGFNGDEAWYGAQALDLLASGNIVWRTPTGNLINPFFFFPVAALSALFQPSIVLLRSVSVASGLAALVANFFLCRMVFGRRTAILSTAALAVLPVSIAYSRFAWDSCQTPLASLLVFYLALAFVKFRQRPALFLALAILAQAAAFLVHPTCIFAAAAILAAISVRWTPEDLKQVAVRCFTDRRILAALLLGGVIVGAAGWRWSKTTGPATVASRFVGARDLAEHRGLHAFVLLYPRLILGTTTVQYITGSPMWSERPSPSVTARLGTDVVVFWFALALAVGMLWRSWLVDRCWEDRTLLSAWGLMLATFLLVAGPAGMSPHYERYALVLVAPTVLVLARGLALGCEKLRRFAPGMLIAASAAGWFLLADFDAHYFRFQAQTGGGSHRAFRTAEVEPKQAALAAILARCGDTGARIASSDYWLYWPLRYLAGQTQGVEVVQIQSKDESVARGCWRVEFVGTEPQQRLHGQLGGDGEILIQDAAGTPLIAVYPPVDAGSPAEQSP